MTSTAKCALCGEPMPEGEEMFKYHGYSGPCPKPPLRAAAPSGWTPEVSAAVYRALEDGLAAESVVKSYGLQSLIANRLHARVKAALAAAVPPAATAPADSRPTWQAHLENKAALQAAHQAIDHLSAEVVQLRAAEAALRRLANAPHGRSDKEATAETIAAHAEAEAVLRALSGARPGEGQPNV